MLSLLSFLTKTTFYPFFLCMSFRGSTNYVIQFFPRGGGLDLKFCMTNDDGHFCEFSVDFDIFSVV